MLNGESVIDLIQRRYSCRSYDDTPIPDEVRGKLAATMDAHSVGPFGTRVRLALIAATADDASALRGLGTYGFIRGATAYIAGAIDDTAPMALEDFGYVMERTVLFATSLGLGTVWLGGTFTKSRFAAAIDLQAHETLPAVVASGLVAERPRGLDALIRRGANADQRLPWEQLFYADTVGNPLLRSDAGPYEQVLEMVRQAPSASNKQPWRLVQREATWDLYLKRSSRYRRRNKAVGVADMQRIDMGIAMCHFALTAAELELAGSWQLNGQAATDVSDTFTRYIASWMPAAGPQGGERPDPA